MFLENVRPIFRKKEWTIVGIVLFIVYFVCSNYTV